MPPVGRVNLIEFKNDSSLYRTTSVIKYVSYLYWIKSEKSVRDGEYSTSRTMERFRLAYSPNTTLCQVQVSCYCISIPLFVANE
jgi:hypothetical protein